MTEEQVMMKMRAELFGRQMKVLLSRVCLKKSMLRGYRIKPCRKRLSRTDAEILRRYMILRHIFQEVILRQADEQNITNRRKIYS